MLGDPMDIRPAIITNWMKVLMTFIDRLGFPIMAFLLMWYLNIELTKTIERNTAMVERLNITLAEIKQTMMLRR